MSTITLKLDNRERGIKDILKLPFQCENLEHGDFVFELDGQQVMIIERKTLQDLAASIKDGRYTNQKKAMLDKYQTSQLYYIFEGVVNYCDDENEVQCNINGLSYSALLSAIINTSVRDKIHTFTTQNTSETCALIEMIYKRMMKDPQKYNNANTTLQQGFIPKEKVKTQRDCFIAQLCQIPGISNKTARAIADKFQGIREFITELTLKGEEIFVDMKLESTNGKTRAVPSNIRNNIMQFMA